MILDQIGGPCYKVGLMGSLFASSRQAVSTQYIALILAVLLFVLQSFSIAHSTEYANPQHYHDDQKCLISALGNRDDDSAILPESAVFCGQNFVFDRVILSYLKMAFVVVAKTSNPRAPPATYHI